MDQPPSNNPYASPADIAEAPHLDTSRIDYGLWRLWIWLGFATAGTFLISPADPLSAWGVSIIAIVSFVIGAISASSTGRDNRAVILMLSILPVSATAGILDDASFIVISAAFYIASVAFGYWAASRTMPHRRLAILGSFCGGYVLGSIFFGVGAIFGAALTTLATCSSLRKHDLRRQKQTASQALFENSSD